MTGIKHITVRVGGLSLLTVGIAMIVLPGPALIVIPAALGILASEYDWARTALRWIREQMRGLKRWRAERKVAKKAAQQ